MRRGDRVANRGRKVEDSYFGEDPLQSFRRLASFGAGPPEPDELLCRHLRSREWSVIRSWLAGPPPDAAYCCLKTLRERGPDGRPAMIEHCTDERGCFQPADRSRESS